MILSYPARSLLLVGGVPGAGKSHLINNSISLPENVVLLSADHFRGMEQIDRGYHFSDFVPECIPPARKKFMTALDNALALDKCVVAEAAYLTDKSRNGVVVPALRNGYTAHLLVLKASLARCLSGVQARARKVERNVVTDYFKDFVRLEQRLLNDGLPVGLSSAVVVDWDADISAVTFAA